MKIQLNRSIVKRLTAGIALVLALFYVALCAKLFVASRFGKQMELTSLRRAVFLDSGNADYHDHLGRFYQLVARDPANAIEQYTTAVRLNPNSARYWFDLASVYQVLGDVANQASAQARALEAGPTTPDVAWEAANLYLVQGESEKALREFRIVLDNDISLTPAAARFCWRLQPDADALLRDVVPPRAAAYIAFLDLLMARKPTDDDPPTPESEALEEQKTQATVKFWQALVHSGEPFEKYRAWDYFAYLIRKKDVDDAVVVWREAVNRFGLSSYLPSSNNLLVNGHFGLNVLNAGFDWRYQKQPGVEVTVDPREGHGNRPSVRINFDGPGIDDAGLIQLVPVQPGVSYEFSAYYETADLQGAGGPHMTIQDMYDPKIIYFDSGELKEDGDWTSVTGEFTAGPDCKLVVLHVRRLPAGSPIRGKLWVDDFRLVRKQ